MNEADQLKAKVAQWKVDFSKDPNKYLKEILEVKEEYFLQDNNLAALADQVAYESVDFAFINYMLKQLVPNEQMRETYIKTVCMFYVCRGTNISNAGKMSDTLAILIKTITSAFNLVHRKEEGKGKSLPSSVVTVQRIAIMRLPMTASFMQNYGSPIHQNIKDFPKALCFFGAGSLIDPKNETMVKQYTDWCVEADAIINTTPKPDQARKYAMTAIKSPVFNLEFRKQARQKLGIDPA